jgi:hypothetical protein
VIEKDETGRERVNSGDRSEVKGEIMQIAGMVTKAST